MITYIISTLSEVEGWRPLKAEAEATYKKTGQ